MRFRSVPPDVLRASRPALALLIALGLLAFGAGAIAVSGSERASKRAVTDRARVVERLAGTWSLLSEQIRDADGDVIGSLYSDAIGKLTYTRRGDVWALTGERERSGSEGAVWYTGRFEVRPNAHTVVHQIRFASPAGIEGDAQLRRYRFRGDRRLTLRAPLGPGQTAVLEWRRVRAG